MLKYAYIPKSNFEAVAKGVSKHTEGKVTEAEAKTAIIACDKDGNEKLSYKETAACLHKHAAALGLKPNDKESWEAAKWELAKAAVIEKKSLKKAFKSMSKKHWKWLLIVRKK